MNKINILDSSIFNRIAAGEVVEKPYSVVKELLDNSIDAKATKITIEIKEGGIKEIKISDDGTGIEPDDFSRVFLPHSTSKIRTVDDLDKIGTLGFRGEALASISSVSRVKLQSKTRDNELGKEMLIEGGITQYEKEIGFDNGTTLTVSDLFFNVPARAKFLRKARQEALDITNLIARYILANPNISFRYVVDDKEVFFSTGNGLEDAIFVVYGKECLDSLIKVDYTSNKGFRVSGYIGNTTYSKANRTYQTLIINGRYVVNSMVSTCVYNCYEHYLMKGQFPFYILNLDIPLDKLDVNVHPNKLDVRFENGNEIYGVIYLAVSNALNSSNTINSVDRPIFEYKPASGGVSFGDKISTTIEDENKYKSPIIVHIPEAPTTNNNDSEEEISKDYTTEKYPIDSLNPNKENSTMQTYDRNLENSENSEQSDYYAKSSATRFFASLADSDNAFKQNSTILSNVYDRVMNNFQVSQEKYEQKSIFSNSIKFVGTLFSTYLLVECDSRVYIIDQHAAHERLLYDKLLSQIDNKEVVTQMLLVPYILNVNSLEQLFIEENLENFKAIGFDIEDFGNLSFKISSIPAILKNANLNTVFNGMLNELTAFKTTKQTELILPKLMQSACKHAVKAGDSLSEDSVASLLNQMKQEQMLLQCPHGRPVVIELTKSELEKWFKRIV